MCSRDWLPLGGSCVAGALALRFLLVRFAAFDLAESDVGFSFGTILASLPSQPRVTARCLALRIEARRAEVKGDELTVW